MTHLLRYKAKLRYRNQRTLLGSQWLARYTKEEIQAEVDYHNVVNPEGKDWAGLSALYSLVTKDLGYFATLEKGDLGHTTDPVPVAQKESLKTRLIDLALEGSDLLTYNEIRILNMLKDNDRKHVANQLGIKKSRLSQILKEIRKKLIGLHLI